MIIYLSKDFSTLAAALQEVYAEPSVACLEPSDWLRDLQRQTENKDTFITRLTLIGHSDNFYGEEQSFFGGNIDERVMLIDEFAHSLINLLKYNERHHPGFCKHLKQIDLIDLHIGEKKFLAPLLADHLQEDVYLSNYGAHIRINSFTNADHPKAGTVLKLHEEKNDTLIFYTFKSAKTFDEYQALQQQLSEKQAELHHLQQMPGHNVMLANNQSRNDVAIRLEKECDSLQKKVTNILQEQTHESHISDPRDFLDKHKACQNFVARAKPPAQGRSHSSTYSPRMFSSIKHTSYLEGNTLRSSPKHPMDDERYTRKARH